MPPLTCVSLPQLSKADKRAHHNALERKRRDHIKDSFTVLRDSIPALTGEKVASTFSLLFRFSSIFHLEGKSLVALVLDSGGGHVANHVVGAPCDFSRHGLKS
jgi:hypothetical protein